MEYPYRKVRRQRSGHINCPAADQQLRKRTSMNVLTRFATAVSVSLLVGCATLSGLGIRAPTFTISREQPSELRLLGPSLERPLGGAALRLNAVVENPNLVGITLLALTGTLQLEGRDAADVDFPLGLPLEAGEATVVPLDVMMSFANLPLLADALPRAVTAGRVDYNLRGTVRVDAGALGQPTFGPMTILAGEVAARR
jgi:hypothetical protein